MKKRFLVRWEIDVESPDAETVLEAAEYVWTRYFGRNLPPEPDSCCVFEVAEVEDRCSAFEPTNFETVDLEVGG